MSIPKILVTGANGQIGRVLTEALRNVYGNDAVLATDITKLETTKEPFEFLDILNNQRLREIVEDHKITQIYHLAAILSANGEWNPIKTWNINLNGLLAILELAREKEMDKIFFPSTIAVFGKTTPRINTPQDVPLLPTTVYGMSKSTGELWCNYYFQRYGVDVRSLRYPGIIGWQSLPAGGTTDYAVEIYHEALKNGKYECFLAENTRLPMMYMDDAIKATIDLMSAPKADIHVRYGYNLAAMSFSPAEIAQEIKKHIPNFEITYKPDFRQDIAASWTESIDDS
ncbi:MAG TPA: NAD-dependent epimerase/dehydratase family protein, partial [Saprospiraceae bacterium]|nr:NAD-dependent epimerase/dehydratase family protein [Saprospiraceae bacterium]